MITGGLVAHPLQKAREVFRFFRETCATLPDEMMMVAGCVTAPDGSGAKLAAMLAGHCNCTIAELRPQLWRWHQRISNLAQ